ncbi:hypothetical protein BpHYR1_033545 [Brachionus plicatilis]|uniref:Uncharacterized protein n=1 Tax=Brachionus plicatilis TaxID=10195 RepID=A0A3M7T2Q7_BRAPC|nr:hypothetical protein BpHYR1_033545 [Brachionus plicatilis]
MAYDYRFKNYLQQNCLFVSKIIYASEVFVGKMNIAYNEVSSESTLRVFFTTKRLLRIVISSSVLSGKQRIVPLSINLLPILKSSGLIRILAGTKGMPQDCRATIMR